MRFRRAYLGNIRNKVLSLGLRAALVRKVGRWPGPRQGPLAWEVCAGSAWRGRAWMSGHALRDTARANSLQRRYEHASFHRLLRVQQRAHVHELRQRAFEAVNAQGLTSLGFGHAITTRAVFDAQQRIAAGKIRDPFRHDPTTVFQVLAHPG